MWQCVWHWESPHCEHKQRMSLGSQHPHEHANLCKLPYGKYVI